MIYIWLDAIKIMIMKDSHEEFHELLEELGEEIKYAIMNQSDAYTVMVTGDTPYWRK